MRTDFLVIDANQVRLSKAKLGRLAITICHRRTGVGADGILYLSTWRGQRKVDVYNADGSWAEKSGNGLRIFARYLWATRKTRRKQFSVDTKGGLVQIENDRIGDELRLERKDGPAVIKQLVESFGDTIESISLTKPSLEDVFVHETGHRFWNES